MADPKLVNVGNAERPILVSPQTLDPETPDGKEWWEGVATGSIVVDDEVLSRLLNEPDGQKKN